MLQDILDCKAWNYLELVKVDKNIPHIPLKYFMTLLSQFISGEMQHCRVVSNPSLSDGEM